MSAKTRSGKVIDLRKKKPGSTGSLSLNWGGPRPSHPKQRHSPLRAKRRRTRLITSLAVFTVLVVIAYGVNWVTHMPRLTIASVDVVGTKDLSSRLIEAYLEANLFDGATAFLSKQNIFLYPRQTLEERLAEGIPRIRTARITREGLLAQAITVTIDERVPKGLWCMYEENDCYLLDENGFIYAHQRDEGALYVFNGELEDTARPIGQTFLPGDFPRMLDFLDKLKELGYPPLGLTYVGEDDVFISLDWGFDVRATLKSDPEKLMRDLRLVLSSEALRGKESRLEYIDLRFGNRVYYKLEVGEEALAE